eukprot:58786-Prorocentrum_minimum.AAC.1
MSDWGLSVHLFVLLPHAYIQPYLQPTSEATSARGTFSSPAIHALCLAESAAPVDPSLCTGWPSYGDHPHRFLQGRDFTPAALGPSPGCHITSGLGARV